MNKNTTLVVCLYGGPGCGKSTMAADVFAGLKWNDINAELVTEFCKDLTWEERHKTFQDQIYIFGKQYHRIHRLLEKVDVIVTDSPILLTPIYDIEHRISLELLVVEEHKKMWTYDIFINRIKLYNPNGRIQTKDQSKKIDLKILDILDKYDICYEVFSGAPCSKTLIIEKIIKLLDYKQTQKL